MSRPTVYLAGPITGLEYDTAQDWRVDVTRELAEAGIDAFSPLRAKEYLRAQGPLEDQYFNLHPLSSGRGVMTRDRYDCTQRDMVLVNFLGATRISIGTVMEVAWADLARKPIVCVMEADNIHHHAMLDEAVGFEVASLDEALLITKAILLPQAVAPEVGGVVATQAGAVDAEGEIIEREHLARDAWQLRKTAGGS